MDVRVLDLADLDVALDIRRRSFGALSPGASTSWKEATARGIGLEQVFGLYDGADLLAMARITDFTQWWAGRSLSMAGIGGVVVAPEHRGRGAGSLLMQGVLERARARGAMLSALYAATVPVYRALGYELAGVQHKITLPTEAVRSIGRRSTVPISRPAPGTAADLRALLNTLHERNRDCGPILG